MIRAKVGWLTILALAIALIGSGNGQNAPMAERPPIEAVPVDPATVSSITGKVLFEGQPPVRVRIRMDATPACAEASPEPVYSQEVVINANRTLRNVFVYVKSGLGNRAFPAPTGEMVLDQKGCIFLPRVLGLVAGQKLRIKNSDPAYHLVHLMPTDNIEWNLPQLAGGEDLVWTFPRPEVMILIKCNVHPWMKAYVGVLPHPFFAVTGTDGSFELKGLLPGEYAVEAWHEKYGTLQQKTTLGAGETETVDFTFKD